MEFLATVEEHNPSVGKILVWTLKNYNLLFIIFLKFTFKTF